MKRGTKWCMSSLEGSLIDIRWKKRNIVILSKFEYRSVCWFDIQLWKSVYDRKLAVGSIFDIQKRISNWMNLNVKWGTKCCMSSLEGSLIDIRWKKCNILILSKFEYRSVCWFDIQLWMSVYNRKLAVGSIFDFQKRISNKINLGVFKREKRDELMMHFIVWRGPADMRWK